MNLWTVAVFGFVWLGAKPQESAATARDVARSVRFDIRRAGVTPDHWAIALEASGQGQYEDLSAAEAGPAGPIRKLQVSAATQEKLGAGYAAVAAGKCETKEKNIAQTGAKHLVYGAAPARAECTFNYSDDDKLNQVVATFQALAQTLQSGDKLKHKHRFDHLGLDAELDGLLSAVKSGYAIELQNIAPILKSIANDEEMMTPARRKAKTLMEMDATLLAKP